MGKFFRFIAFVVLISSCGHENRKSERNTEKQGDKSVTISTDTSLLSKLIDIKTFRPANVKFQYTYFDNSGQNERLSIPGPSDSHVEAVLFFDDTSFQQLKRKYFMMDYPDPGFDRQEFNFEWLDEEIKMELLHSDTGYHGHPDYFFGHGIKSKSWFLHNKVLISMSND